MALIPAIYSATLLPLTTFRRGPCGGLIFAIYISYMKYLCEDIHNFFGVQPSLTLEYRLHALWIGLHYDDLSEVQVNHGYQSFIFTSSITINKKSRMCMSRYHRPKHWYITVGIYENIGLQNWYPNKMVKFSKILFQIHIYKCERFVFLKLLWCLFQLTLRQHYFRYWLGDEHTKDHYLNQCWLMATTHMESLFHSEMIQFFLYVFMWCAIHLGKLLTKRRLMYNRLDLRTNLN